MGSIVRTVALPEEKNKKAVGSLTGGTGDMAPVSLRMPAVFPKTPGEPGPKPYPISINKLNYE